MQFFVEFVVVNGIEKWFVGDDEVKFMKSWFGVLEVMYMWFQLEYEVVFVESKGEMLL